MVSVWYREDSAFHRAETSAQHVVKWPEEDKSTYSFHNPCAYSRYEAFDTFRPW